MYQKLYVHAVRRIDFVDKETNKRICGYSLYLGEECNDRGWSGITCEKSFVGDDRIGGRIPMPGDYVNVAYNRYGKIDAVSVC